MFSYENFNILKKKRIPIKYNRRKRRNINSNSDRLENNKNSQIKVQKILMIGIKTKNAKTSCKIQNYLSL